MAAASASKAPSEGFGDDLLLCSICLEPYRSPKVLPCLHSFCTQCLERHHDVFKLKNAGRLSCPTCRELIDVPADKGVKGLRADDAVARTGHLLGQLTDCWDSGGGEAGCAGAEGGTDGGTQLKADIQHTVDDLHQTISQLRTKLLQVYQVESHVNYALQAEHAASQASPSHASGSSRKRNKQAEVARAHAQKVESHELSLAQLAVEQDRLHQSFVELKSTHDVLEILAQRGSSEMLCSNEKKILRLMSDVTPFLDKSSPAHKAYAAAGGLDVDTIAVSYASSPTHTGKKSKTCGLFAKNKKADQVPVKLIATVGGRGIKSGKFDFPVHVSFVGEGGGFIVCDKNNKRLQRFGRDGEFVCKLLCGEVKPRRAVVSPVDGLLYVSDEVSECVKVYTQDGTLVRRIGETFFQCPAGLAVDSKGDIVMTDAEKCFVSVHNPNGDNTLKFYHRYLSDRLIPNPYYVATNDDGELIVSDLRNNTIKVFSSSGKLLFIIRNLQCPRGVCIDPFGNILVAEGDAHRVSMYDPYGKFLRHLVTSSDGLEYPLALAMDRQGRLLVTQCGYYSPHQVLIFQIY